MRAEMFYQSRSEDALPLFLLSKEDWEKGQQEFESREKNFFTHQQFTGKLGDCCIIYDSNGGISKIYLASETTNQASAMAHAALKLPEGCYQVQQPLSQAAKTAWALAQYRFMDYKQSNNSPRILSIKEDELKPTLMEANTLFTVRDLINKPTNDLGPAQLASALENLANKYQAHFEQWVGEELVEANFNGIHAVGRAAATPPRLLSLIWGDEKHPRLCLVGKGVCFDSGGLDIKPSSGMRLMKKDMAGAAHAIGLAQWIMEAGLPLRLQVLIPAVENAVGPDSFRPGDIIKTSNGLTVEIDNTDAEGRLILAEALVKAGEEKPELIIDFATLTGAARAAVGTDLAALFTNNDELAIEIEKAAKAVNDPVWRLPLYEGYESLLDSSIADLANCSASPYAGAITAALFLQRFVPKDTNWVHFDMMAWNLCSKPGKPEGGEAMTLRALMYFLQKSYGN